MTRRRIVYGATALAVGLSIPVVGLTGVSAAGADGSLTINSPSSPVAGPVTLTGTVGAGPGEVTSVLYVLDATQSTAAPTGADCSGNGVVTAADDLNDDGIVGDVLDCEIAGVAAFNNGLESTSGLKVGLVAFANQGAAADVDPAPGDTALVSPGFTGGDPQPRIDSVTGSVVRSEIGLYTNKDLGGSGAGTAFNSAIQTSLATLAAAPAGPKWIIFLSDGQSPIDDSLLTQLAGSGIRLRSFGIGQDATCAKSGSLYKMASATGEACVLVSSPASLAADLTGSEPDAVNGVTVTIADVSVAADIDPVGGWSAAFTLGQGTYTAKARAVLASGSTMTKSRTFTVAAAPGPPPGSVAPGPGALRASTIKVDRPRATRTVTPAKVTGRVGRVQRGLQPTRRLKGATVLLQARKTAGDPWTTVDRDKVNKRGEFALAWKPLVRLPLLQVALQPFRKYAGSSAAVPKPPISSCKVKRRGTDGWSVTCLTTAKNGSVARLLDGRTVLDKSKVKKGSLRLHGTGPVSKRVIDVTVRGRHVKLVL